LDVGKIIILEAATLTITVVISFSLYTFWTTKRDRDFKFLGRFLCGALSVLIFVYFIQVFCYPLIKVLNNLIGTFALLIVILNL
jgi:FtsH-binding integral membrane protein